MNTLSVIFDPRRFLLKAFLAMLGAQLACYLGVGPLCYWLVLTWGVARVFRRPAETMWIGFLLLSVTSLIYPTHSDELGNSAVGSYRPYTIAVLALMASTAAGLWIRLEASNPSQGKRWILGREIWTLCGMMLVSLVYGYYAAPHSLSLLDIFRRCNGWATLLIFIFVGYRSAPSLEETRELLAKFRLAVVAFSSIFLMNFFLLAVSAGADQTAAGFGYSQRDMTFFAGVAFTGLVAEILVPRSERLSLLALPAGISLIGAALLSGSRSVVLSSIIALLLLAMAWRRSCRWVLIVSAVAVLLLLVRSTGGMLGAATSGEASNAGFLGFLTGRFFSLSTDDTSLLARASEFSAVADAVRANPLLGKGALASFSFFDPLFGWRDDQSFVDSGLGDLLMKTGLLGICAFGWFALRWLRVAKRAKAAFTKIGVTMLAMFLFYLVYLPFGPSFFEFQHSWFIGLVIGQTIFLASVSAHKFAGSANLSSCPRKLA